MSLVRTRWAAIGAAVAVTLGGGGIAMVSATSPAGAVTYVPITPCRVFDTRPDFNVGPKTSPVGPNEEHAVTATGASGECTQIPANATAVTMNLTAVGATLPTFLAVYATGATRPNSSTLNPQPGQPPLPNAVTTELSPDGEFTVYHLQGSVDAFADIVGYYVDHTHDDRYYTKNQVDDRSYTKSQVDAEISEIDETIARIEDALAERPQFLSIIRLSSGSNGYAVEQGVDPGFTITAVGSSRFVVGLSSSPARTAMESANCTPGFSGLEVFQVYKSIEFGAETTAELELIRPDGTPLPYNGRTLYCTIWQ